MKSGRYKPKCHVYISEHLVVSRPTLRCAVCWTIKRMTLWILLYLWEVPHVLGVYPRKEEWGGAFSVLLYNFLTVQPFLNRLIEIRKFSRTRAHALISGQHY